MAPQPKPNKKDMKMQIRPKTSLTSPFSLQWSPLLQDDMNFILKTLQEKVASTALEKRQVKVFRPWRKKKGQTSSSSSVPPEASRDSDKDSPRGGWTNVAARRQLAIGINEVTKALEKNDLRLVLVCKTVKPKHMTHHLMTLSATRGVPAGQLPRLSPSLSGPLGLRSVLALGFRRCVGGDEDVFTDAVEAITPRVPALDVGWLQSGGGGAAAAAAGKTRQRPGDLELEEAAKRSGQKRKLEDEADAAESASSCALQPLTVKKVVPNPAKKKKLK